MFEVKQFNSGEWDVKLTERITKPQVTIHWNWFTEPDIMIPLMKIDAIRRQYGTLIDINLNVPYLPYSRQDRVFEAGQPLPLEILLDRIFSDKLYQITTYGCHAMCEYTKCYNKRFDLYHAGFRAKPIYIFADSNARKHFVYDYDSHKLLNFNYFNKVSNSSGVYASLNKQKDFKPTDEILLCDDICDGGRTFVECSKILKNSYGHIGKINLLIYHAFMTHGLDELKKYINHIYIINPDSYEYIISKFPEEKDYFTYMELRNV